MNGSGLSMALKPSVPSPTLALGHAHHHAGQEGLVAAARAALAVVDAVEQGVAHQHPAAVGVDHDPAVRRGVGLPAGAGGVAGHAVGAERTVHGRLLWTSSAFRSSSSIITALEGGGRPALCR